MTMRPRPPATPVPVSPALVRGMTRRRMLGGTGALGLGGLLASCSTGGSTVAQTAAARPSPAIDRSDTDRVVNWANWTQYLDYDEQTKTYPTLTQFEKETGIQATYSEDIDDNETYYAKIQGQLANGQDIGKDLIVLTDYMAGRVIRQGYAQELDLANIPNVKYLLDNLKNVDFDPGRKYSLAWQSGYTGLAYRRKEVEAKGISVNTISDLWNPKLKGRVEVQSDFRDTLGLILLEQGVDVAKPFPTAKFDDAIAVVGKQLANGQIRQVKGGEYLEDFKAGDALAVVGWSGDIFAANAEARDADPNLQEDPYVFVFPPSGVLLWSDNLLVPIGATHKKNAEILINYYYDPKVAAKVADYVEYICPVKGAAAALRAEIPDDADLADSRFIFPTAEDLAKTHVFRTLTVEEDTLVSTKYQAVLGA